MDTICGQPGSTVSSRVEEPSVRGVNWSCVHAGETRRYSHSVSVLKSRCEDIKTGITTTWSVVRERGRGGGKKRTPALVTAESRYQVYSALDHLRADCGAQRRPADADHRHGPQTLHDAFVGRA